MAGGKPFEKTHGGKLLFIATYTVLLAGLLLWTLFLLSTFSGSRPFFAVTTWFSISPSPPPPPPLRSEITNSSVARQDQHVFCATPHQQFVKDSSHPSVGTAKTNFSGPTPSPNATVYVPSSAASLAAPPRPQNMLTKPIWEVPVGTSMPDLKAFQLTKEMVEHRAKDNVIVMTFGNYAFMDFMVNWVRHLTDLNVFNLLVGAMDNKVLGALYWKGIPVFDMGSNLSPKDVGWGSPTFHKMGREKVFLVNAILSFGYELLMCDTDMVWLKDPLPYIARFPNADILTSSDQLVPTVIDDSLEDWQGVTNNYNIGIFHWRPTNPARRLAKEWKYQLLRDDTLWDQGGFNDLVRKVLGPSVEGEDGLVYAFDGRLKLGILPSSIFCSGHTYFVQALPQQLRLEPYAVHTTFQFSGTEGKRHRLREAMFIHDPPEYYDSSGGFLAFKPRIPRSLLLDGAHTLESHFSLVNYQLKHIRNALAIASLLNRTLVFPPLWCRIDTLAAMPPGTFLGSMTPQPFLCPLDHVMEVNIMLSELPKTDFGPKIDFREYSFLQNPSLPKKVKESFLEVQLCGKQSLRCIEPNKTIQRVLRFPENSNQDTLIQVFSKYKDVKVIQFSSMNGAFGGFTNKMMEAKFRNRVKRYVRAWCCLADRIPSHIYFDMFWDEKPDWKPVPPKSTDEDHPPW